MRVGGLPLGLGIDKPIPQVGRRCSGRHPCAGVLSAMPKTVPEAGITNAGASWRGPKGVSASSLNNTDLAQKVIAPDNTRIWRDSV
jgi:hypothetical protein